MFTVYNILWIIALIGAYIVGYLGGRHTERQNREEE